MKLLHIISIAFLINFIMAVACNLMDKQLEAIYYAIITLIFAVIAIDERKQKD